MGWGTHGQGRPAVVQRHLRRAGRGGKAASRGPGAEWAAEHGQETVDERPRSRARCLGTGREASFLKSAPHPGRSQGEQRRGF